MRTQAVQQVEERAIHKLRKGLLYELALDLTEGQVRAALERIDMFNMRQSRKQMRRLEARRA